MPLTKASGKIIKPVCKKDRTIRITKPKTYLLTLTDSKSSFKNLSDKTIVDKNTKKIADAFRHVIDRGKTIVNKKGHVIKTNVISVYNNKTGKYERGIIHGIVKSSVLNYYPKNTLYKNLLLQVRLLSDTDKDKLNIIKVTEQHKGFLKGKLL